MAKFSSIDIRIVMIIISSMFFFGSAAGNELTDNKINSEIKDLLYKEPDIPTKRITVTTRDGIVTVEGKVDTRLQADRIIELINTIDEVQEIDSSKLKTTGSNQYVKDAFITAAIKGKIVLLNKNGKIDRNSTFHIETTNGRVHVYGKAANKQEIETVISKIHAIKGVKEVLHSIEIY